MALQEEQVVDIPGLNGEEIITDLLEQVAGKLRRDCNLRQSDSYVNGYSAEITVKIHCYGIDTAEVDSTLHVQKHPPAKVAGPEKTTEVESEIRVAHEPDLSAVRERSQQTAPDVEHVPEPLDGSEREIKKPARRSYGKPVANGGAGSFNE